MILCVAGRVCHPYIFDMASDKFAELKNFNGKGPELVRLLGGEYWKKGN